MRASLSDQLKLKVRNFHERIEASKDSHPVNFDDVWTLAGYSRRDNAKRALKGPGIDGKIIFLRPEEVSGLLHRSVELNYSDPKRGPPPETILMTVGAFKLFCMRAPTEQGKQICEYYIEMEDIAREALKVAAAVASGDVTAPKAVTAAGAKRLRQFEDTINITAKKMKSYEAQRNDEITQIRALAVKARQRADERDEAVRQANAEIHEYHRARDAHVEQAKRIHEEQERLRRRYNTVTAKIAHLTSAADADFAAVKQDMEREMRERQHAWVLKHQQHGGVVTPAMETALRP